MESRKWLDMARKATARVPARPRLIPRLYYDYDETAPQAVLSRGGGG